MTLCRFKFSCKRKIKFKFEEFQKMCTLEIICKPKTLHTYSNCSRFVCKSIFIEIRRLSCYFFAAISSRPDPVFFLKRFSLIANFNRGFCGLNYRLDNDESFSSTRNILFLANGYFAYFLIKLWFHCEAFSEMSYI